MVRSKIANAFAAALLLVAVASGVGRAQDFGPDGPGFRDHHGFLGGPMMLASLNLTPSQKSQVQQIMSTLRSNIEPLFQQLHQGHAQITAKLLAPGPVAMTDLNAILQQNELIHQQIEQQKIAAVLQVRALLTTDQLNKAAVIQQKMQQIHAEMQALFNNGEAPAQPTP